jgi:hypothetical protein
VTKLPQVKVAVKISVFALADMSWAQVQWASDEDDPGSIKIWVYRIMENGERELMLIIMLRIDVMKPVTIFVRGGGFLIP